MILIHIIFGSLSLIAGAVALTALKGGALHRKSGMVFVIAMLIMSLTGAIIAAMMPVRVSVLAGSLSFYLIVTSLLTVKPWVRYAKLIDVSLLLLAMTIAVGGCYFGMLALGSATGELDQFPAAPHFVFAAVAFIAALLDGRRLIAGGVSGKHRIARHLWRMGMAMYIATSAFFLGQAQHFPQAMRKVEILAVPVILVIAVTAYWLVRTLLGKRVISASSI